MTDIKETKEVVSGVVVLSAFLIKQFRDGVGIDDAVAIIDKLKNDEGFKVVLLEAVKGVQKVPAEVSDLDTHEILELILHVGQMIPTILDAFKKD